MKIKNAWTVVWVNEENEYQARSTTPMTLEGARLLADLANKEYPHLRHEVVPWGVSDGWKFTRTDWGKSSD